MVDDIEFYFKYNGIMRSGGVYNSAFNEFILNTIDELQGVYFPELKNIRKKNGSLRIQQKHVLEDKELTLPSKEINMSFQIKTEDVLSFNLDNLSVDLVNMSETQGKELGGLLYDSINSLCNFTGNIVSGNNNFFDGMVEAISKVKLDFTKENPLEGYEAHVSTQVYERIQNRSPDEINEFERRVENLLLQKRKEYDDQKGIRTLS